MFHESDFLGVRSDVFHPISLFSIGLSVVYHTARLFSPDTLVFRRVRKSSPKHSHKEETASQLGNNESDVSQASSRVSRRFRTASTSNGEDKQRAHSADVVGSAPSARPSTRRSRSDDHRTKSDNAAHSSSGRVTVGSRSASAGVPNREGGVTPLKPDATPMVGKPPLADGSQLHHRSRRSSAHSQRSRVNAGKPEKDAASSVRGSKTTTLGRSPPLSWISGWRRISRRKVTKAAEFFVHVYHSLPVSTLHYFCVLQWQIAAVPSLCFPDISERGHDLLHEYICSGGMLSSASTRVTPPPRQSLLSSRSVFGASRASSSSSVASTGSQAAPSYHDMFFSPPFVTVREMLRLAGTYLVDVLFMDNTIVVRQLRSRNYIKRSLGWALRIAAHTLVDSISLSVISTILCLKVTDFTRSGPLCFTMPGLIKSILWSAGVVVVDRFLSPVLSHLVNRAMVTLFEAVEYFIQRRYTYVDHGGLFSDSSSERASFAGDHDYSESEGSEIMSKKSSRSALTTQVQGEAMDEDAMRAARIREQEKIYERERRERHRLRRERVAAQETSVQRTIIRAILYRLISLLTAQIVVEHPFNVLLEVMRGRSMMHLTGILREYDASSSDAYPISWAGIMALVENTVNENSGVPAPVAVIRAVGMSAGEEINAVCQMVVSVSGQLEYIRAISQRVAESEGSVPSAFDSVGLAWHSMLSLSSLYRGVSFTILDNLLSFYVGTWRRLAG